jgi:hypothetical protein
MFFLAVLLTFSINSYGQKLSAEEVIAKHVDSIGIKDNRDKIKSQLIVGNVQINIKGSANKINGKGLILSSNNKNLWAMNFASNDYPQERFGFNGKNSKVSFARPGAYSDLGRFISSYDELLKEGLMGGTLSSSWALLNSTTRNAKVGFEGTKKINGTESYVLSYSPKGGSDLTIKMYFDAKTFQHLRTDYNRVVAASMGGGVDNSARQSESRYRLVEEFSNFKKAGDLVLPAVYKLSYSYSNDNPVQAARNPNRELELEFNTTDFSFNNPLEAEAFEIAGK